MKHKVLLVLLLGIIISVSASAQKVTMNLKQVKLEKVFSAITQQTGLTVAYSQPYDRQSGSNSDGRSKESGTI
ncbi:hypothetical protein PO249_23025 [Bacteroides ovatus]|nr:hypothetical protein [Bacteroides ovatus]MDC2620271.1 hypothetical protein [Bacteroides ovatus]